MGASLILKAGQEKMQANIMYEGFDQDKREKVGKYLEELVGIFLEKLREELIKK